MIKKLLILPAIAFILFAFNFGGKPSYKSALKTLEGFCNYVPSGNALIEGDTFSVQAFYMSQTEITNIQYLEFLYDLKKRGEVEKYKIAQLDTNAWNVGIGANANYTMYYHKHPAYHNYPVVNVSREGAELFCEWLTEKYDSLSGGELKLKFRIPTRAEWIRAVRGSDHSKVYAWNGPSIRNSKGEIMANHLNISNEMITRDLKTNELTVTLNGMSSVVYTDDNADVTAPAESYWPNDFGFYNMNGNVSEMISDGSFAVGGDWRSPGYDVRNESIRSFEGPEPTVGFRIVASYIEPAE